MAEETKIRREITTHIIEGKSVDTRKAMKKKDPTDCVLNEVRLERKHQDTKWGEQNHGPYKWLAIITEELGEAAEAVLKADCDDNARSLHYLNEYREELIQIAASAAAAIESLDRQGK